MSDNITQSSRQEALRIFREFEWQRTTWAEYKADTQTDVTEKIAAGETSHPIVDLGYGVNYQRYAGGLFSGNSVSKPSGDDVSEAQMEEWRAKQEAGAQKTLDAFPYQNDDELYVLTARNFRKPPQGVERRNLAVAQEALFDSCGLDFTERTADHPPARANQGFITNGQGFIIPKTALQNDAEIMALLQDVPKLQR